MQKSNCAEIGVFLQKRRFKVNLSQTDVSNFLGYTSGQIVSNWERGEQLAPMNKVGDISQLYQLSEVDKHKFIHLMISSEVQFLAKAMKIKGYDSGVAATENILSAGGEG